jgi:hypothetical protein
VTEQDFVATHAGVLRLYPLPRCRPTVAYATRFGCWANGDVTQPIFVTIDPERDTPRRSRRMSRISPAAHRSYREREMGVAARPTVSITARLGQVVQRLPDGSLKHRLFDGPRWQVCETFHLFDRQLWPKSFP